MPLPDLSVILTHENADFDAISALVGAHKLYPEAIPVLPRHVNRNIRHFLTLYGVDLPMVEIEDVPRGRVRRVLLVDTQAMVTIRGMHDDVEVQVIDHHPRAPDLDPSWQFWGETVGAVTTMLVERLIAEQHAVRPIEATLFAMGIYEDTGSLSYATTTTRDVACVAWLLEQGASLEVANEFLHYPLTDDQQALYEQLLEEAETHHVAGQSILVAAVTYPRYVEEVSVLAHRLRDLWDPDGLFLLVHFALPGQEQVQLVARSTSDAIDVGAIAQDMGGGGHSRASAALIRDMDLAQAKARLLELLDTHVEPTLIVRQIMSYGAHTVSPGMTVAQAAELMQRYGHEGFPVVQEGRVVGIVARREIDRAMRLGLENAAIATYMTKGEIAVRPDDPIESLQQVMLDHGVGQVPVVSPGGAILGIVTRTDLIRLLLKTPNEAPLGPRREEVARMLDDMVPQHRLSLLWMAADRAQSLGYTLYIVGGFVRDLLLGRPNQDIDLVVEGNAIALAKALARQVGGRVRTHARFGTAKWILDGDESLDFVTARTEFYTQATALPQVEPSSIKQDLHRRDFTINTLAIRLDADHRGELLDFFGGEQDVRDGVIRVLHSLSFVEDSTRILRAIRLEQRLGFVIEPRTLELIENALGLLARRVSGERIRHELFLLFQEPEPEAGLARMEELHVLRQIHPALICDGWLQAKFRALRAAMPAWYEESWRSAPAEEEHDGLHGTPLPANNAHQLYLALLSYRLILPELDTLCTRLKLAKDDVDLLHEVAALKTRIEALQVEDVSPSAVYRLLAPFSGPTVLVTWVATDSSGVREHLARYWQDYRHARPILTGNDLKGMGYSPGPAFGAVLDALRDAHLDGHVSSEEEERAIARAILDAAPPRKSK
ncbi:MAG: CBS domain-containing protein [Anaerolineae bacterium]|nr:CBS domain-containing protein [Anaerolineae bacterium]